METESTDSRVRLRINLLGSFEAWVGERPLPPLRSRKGQWLLALLALRLGREVDRDWLAGTLWPESEKDLAYSSLRRTLTDLRRALGDAACLLDAPNVHRLRLQREGVFVDLARFDEAYANRNDAALDTALCLYRGPLLEGCTEEWVIAERAAREQAYLTLLDAAAKRARDAGEMLAAVGYLRRIVAADPFRESACRDLMQALAETGNPAAATRAYRELRSRLLREMNAEPSPETRALFERIQKPGLSASSAKSERAKDRLFPIQRLPNPLTSLVDREGEAAALRERLKDSRLVTLTGAGGVGKTRVAIRVAESVKAAFTDGVCFVDLAAVSDPSRVPGATLSALGAQEATPGRSPLQALEDLLERRSLLLILDNCEHLSDASAQLAAALLGTCPNLRILATSRQPLGLIGEVRWPIPPLEVPAASLATGDGDLSGVVSPSPAVQLFIERARSVRPSFTLDGRNVSAVLDLCRRLDGLPLAIELAAARLSVLSVEQIADRLDQRFSLLQNNSCVARPHQQTHRTMMDWSYHLLSSDEQALFRRLSVFAGGWGIERAEAVCSDDEGGTPGKAALTKGDILPLIAALVEKSLVVAEPGRDGARYRMLETVREYSREQRVASGESERWGGRHCREFLAFAERVGARFRGPEQTVWFDRMEDEYANLRAALAWAKADPDGAEAEMRLAGALGWFWSLRGYVSEGREWLEHALERGGHSVSPHRAKALEGAGRLAWHGGEILAAETRFQACIDAWRRMGEKNPLAYALHNLGWLRRRQGRYAESLALHDERLALFREGDDDYGLADGLLCVGKTHLVNGDPDAATPYYEEGLIVHRRTGDRFGLAHAFMGRGELAALQGEFGTARRCFTQALDLMREVGYRSGTAVVMDHLGQVALRQGDEAEAHRRFAESLAIRQEIGSKAHLLTSLERFAEAAHAGGDGERAVRLLSAAVALRKVYAIPLHETGCADPDETPSRLRAVLGERAFIMAWEAGRTLSLDDAMAYALDTRLCFDDEGRKASAQ